MAWPTKLLAFILGPSKPGAHPFLNDNPLELGKDVHHLKHGLACWRRGVETLLVQKQVDVERGCHLVLTSHFLHGLVRARYGLDYRPQTRLPEWIS
jgi:hypothetical protein